MTFFCKYILKGKKPTLNLKQTFCTIEYLDFYFISLLKTESTLYIKIKSKVIVSFHLCKYPRQLAFVLNNLLNTLVTYKNVATF